MGKLSFYGKPKTYPYYALIGKGSDKGITGVFKTKKETISAAKHFSMGQSFIIVDRRRRKR